MLLRLGICDSTHQYMRLSIIAIAIDSVGNRSARSGRLDAGGAHVRHSTKKRTITLPLQHLNRLLWQRNPLFLKRLEPGIEVCEAEFEVQRRGQRFEDAAPRGDDFAADAVAGDET